MLAILLHSQASVRLLQEDLVTTAIAVLMLVALAALLYDHFYIAPMERAVHDCPSCSRRLNRRTPRTPPRS